MNYCYFCRKNVPGVKIIHAPKCEMKRKLWEESLGCSLSKNSQICDTHFNASQWRTALKGKIYKKRRLNNDAVPQREKEDESVKEGYANASTETEDTVINHSTSMEIKTLRQKIRALEDEVQSLRKLVEDASQLEKSLSTIFTQTQIKILKSGGKRSEFNSDDISWAMCLHTAGPRAYNHLYKKGFPLPCRATLYKWLSNVEIQTGCLDVVIDLMDNMDMDTADKLCVLAFDEMKVAGTFEYDSSADLVYEPSEYVQLAMVRGLKKSWKQPVFFDYDTRMDVPTLYELIKKLHRRGYFVVSIVSDMGAGNQRLWRELGISEEKTWFGHPEDEDLKIFVFSDAPHLIKLVRNHYLATGLHINGQTLTKSTVEQTITHCCKTDVTILFKVNESHLNVRSFAKQKVKLATQLFSNTTASAIRRCYSLGYQVENAVETSDLFKLLNDWFDVFNSKLSTSNCIETTQPYGKQLELQRDILKQMSHIMSNRICGQTHRLPFQKGILINNASLDGLHAYCNEKYGMEYILTSRLNQDIVENFFGAMRAKGGQHDHPSPLQFKYRLRKYIVAKNTELLAGNGNVDEDNCDSWLNLNITPNGNKENEPDEGKWKGWSKEFEEFEIEMDNNIAAEYIMDELTEDAMEYLAGYVVRKLRLSNESTQSGFTYVDEVSHGGLIKPSDQFTATLKHLESIFINNIHNTIEITKDIKKKLLIAAKHVQIDNNVKQFYFKTRIYFRLKYLNKKLAIKNQKQRLVGNSKLLKIKL
nr:O-type P element protein {exons 0-3} [Drosophila bifasciata, Peptide Transposon Partial, 757 aa] [Drosophila bifasciata]